MGERMRWRVARSLDRLPRMCWADLVTWALGWHPLREVKRTDECSSPTWGYPDGGCYCNKAKGAADG